MQVFASQSYSADLNYLKSQLKPSPIPRHVAIIMDGNGRWAARRGLSRIKGHQEGALNIGKLLSASLEYKIEVVSLYAFSTENWNRPRSEINALFKLLNNFIVEKISEFKERGVRIMVSGDTTSLPFTSQKLIERAIEETRDNSKITANFCLNYGSHDEICMAVNSLIQERLKNSKRTDKTEVWSQPITSDELKKYFYTSALPDVDLMVRTGGELRLSNFLLQQCAYAELYFTSIPWPDFDTNELYKSLLSFQQRNRKFGGAS